MRKTVLVLALAITSTTAFLASCKKASPDPDSATTINPAPLTGDIVTGRVGIGGNCDPQTVSLIAGQNINAGSISVTNDNDFIYVTYTSDNGYLITQTHLYVGDCALIPVNGQGNPLPGHFPYSSAHNNISSYTYQVPISALPAGTCGCIAAHCVLVKLGASGNVIETQTGWGNGTRINPTGGNWGMKFSYCSCQ